MGVQQDYLCAAARHVCCQLQPGNAECKLGTRGMGRELYHVRVSGIYILQALRRHASSMRLAAVRLIPRRWIRNRIKVCLHGLLGSRGRHAYEPSYELGMGRSHRDSGGFERRAFGEERVASHSGA